MGTREIPYEDGDRDDEHFVSVAAYSTVTHDQVVPSGETWRVSRFQGSAVYLSEAVAKLVWDYGGTEEVIASTHGDGDFVVSADCAGNGSKKLSIVLDNQSANVQSLGARYVATRIL